MIRISKLTDYAIIILAFLSKTSEKIWTTTEIATQVHLSKPTTAKILKILTNKNLVISLRGKDGGYKIAVDPHNISLANIIIALEGQVAITECNSTANCCPITKHCPLVSALTKINTIIYDALNKCLLSELITYNKTNSLETIL